MNHSRQARRAAHCIKAHSPRGHEELGLSSRGRGADLANVAARIAEELELSPDVLDDLLWGPTATGGGIRKA